jgi:hypothetical protein
LNSGKPTNIPQLVSNQPPDAIQRILNGKPNADDTNRAIERAMQRVLDGQTLPFFETIDEAVLAAQARSDKKSLTGILEDR